MQNKRDLQSSPRFGLVYFALAIWLILFVFDFVRTNRNLEIIPYSQFLKDVETSQVSEVTVGTEKIQGTLKSAPEGRHKDFIVNKIEDPDLVDRLGDAGVKFGGASPRNTPTKALMGQ